MACVKLILLLSCTVSPCIGCATQKAHEYEYDEYEYDCIHCIGSVIEDSGRGDYQTWYIDTKDETAFGSNLDGDTLILKDKDGNHKT